MRQKSYYGNTPVIYLTVFEPQTRNGAIARHLGHVHGEVRDCGVFESDRKDGLL